MFQVPEFYANIQIQMDHLDMEKKMYEPGSYNNQQKLIVEVCIPLVFIGDAVIPKILGTSYFPLLR